jgi:hypothetical protein
MKNTVFWDVAPCRYFVNRRFGGTYCLPLQGRRNPRVMNQRERVAVDWVTVRYTQLYKNRKGREGAIWETSGEERGRVCGVRGQQVAGQGRTFHPQLLTHETLPKHISLGNFDPQLLTRRHFTRSATFFQVPVSLDLHHSLILVWPTFCL